MIKIFKLIEFWTYIKQLDKRHVNLVKNHNKYKATKKLYIYFDKYLLANFIIKSNII